MNGLAQVGTNQNGLLAAMALPLATPSATPQTPAFVNMISLFLSNPAQATPTAAPKAAVTTATPAQLADSMIKSMLGNPSFGSSNPSCVPVQTAPAPAQIADSKSVGSTAWGASSLSQLPSLTTLPAPTTVPARLADSTILNDLSLGSSALSLLSLQATARPAVTDASKQFAAPTTTASPTQIADSMIQSMLDSEASGPANSSPSTAPGANRVVASDARKQVRSVADPSNTLVMPPVAASASTTVLPSFTTPTAPSPAPQATTQSSPAPAAPATTVTGAPQLPQAASIAAPLPKSQTAFTAILTPTKDVETPVNAGDVKTPIATQASTAASAAISTTSQQTPAVQNAQSQAPAVEIGKDHAGNNMQQGGDTSSHDQSSATPARAASTADQKAKPAGVKQDDNGIAAAIQDRAPVAPSVVTAYPEPARTAAAPQPETAAPALPPSQTAAETIRTSEPTLPAAPQLRTGAAQEISIRIAQPDASTVDLRIVERSGQVHVDVRASDAAMQTSLRQDLGSLTNSLERAGYHSETFTPTAALGRANAGSQAGNQDDRQDQFQNRGGAGDFSEGRRQQQQKRPSTWLEELEEQQ